MWKKTRGWIVLGAMLMIIAVAGAHAAAQDEARGSDAQVDELVDAELAAEHGNLEAPQSTHDELPENIATPFVPIDTVYAEDFAEDDGGYEVDGTNAWEFGTPSEPPEIRPGQTPDLWGTTLDGAYDAGQCSFLETGPIDLSAYPAGVARLSFDHWYEIEQSSFGGSAWDAGIVYVSNDGEDWQVIDPVEGYPADDAYSNAESCLGIADGQGVVAGASDGWELAEFDVSEYMGDELHVRFGFSSDGIIHHRGWYVDNVAVQFGAGASAHAVEGLSVPDVPDLPDPDDPTDLPTVSPPPNPLTWTIGGENPSWEEGMKASGPGEGEYVYAQNLDGPHNLEECSHITSPAVSGDAFSEDPTLTIEHMYDLAGAHVDVAWAGGAVLVSTDLGSTWDYVELDEYTRPADTRYDPLPECLESHGLDPDAMVFSGRDTSDWLTADADLSEYVGASTVQVRLLVGTYTTFDYDGWTVKSVELGGQQLFPLVG